MNTQPIFSLRLLTSDDLHQVAKIHSKAFDDSALTNLGAEPIRRYYEWQLIGPHECHAIGAFTAQGALAGFCFSGVFHGSLSGFLSHNKLFLILWIISHPWKIKNPLIVDRLKRAVQILNHKPKTSSPSSTQPKPTYGILSIAVDPKLQGMGVGHLIMEDVIKDALQKGFAEMGLTVHPDNTIAVRFYERNGWKKINKNQKEEWSGGMTLTLNQ